jgi:lipoprotein-releasing system ATP-binding protein
MSSSARTKPAFPPGTQAPKDTLLSARGIKKAFQIADRSLEVLHGVDFDVGRGELVALMGASGAGKTTLIQILGLLDAPTAGTVMIDGRSAWTLPTQQRASLRNQEIGFVFQFYHLLPELDALENVLLPGMIGHSIGGWRKHGKELRERARGMLVKFGLEKRLGHRPSQLSGGERQRVAIARALLLDPKIVIADEPTGNLDTTTGEKVLEMLLNEQRERGLSLLLVTHDERLAARCQRIVRMEDGRILG